MASNSIADDVCMSKSSLQDDINQINSAMKEYLLLEHKFQPQLYLPTHSEDNSEVTTGSRDGAAHVMRALKLWFRLPSEVFIDAISLFDRFLTKMKVQPCHIPCITVSCMDIAIEKYYAINHQTRRITIEELLSALPSPCTVRDARRMALVIADKLQTAGGSAAGQPCAAGAVTALHWTRAALAALRCVALRQHMMNVVPEEDDFVSQLELLLCDAKCVSGRTPALVLGLLQRCVESRLAQFSRGAEPGAPLPAGAYALLEVIEQLQAFCNLTPEEVQWASSVSAEGKLSHRSPLVWRISRRTQESLRPTDRLTSLLPTIEEQQASDSTRTENDNVETHNGNW